ncbi:MAG: SDR family NAD(P)-dependent oxidoreductase [Caldilineaceae bacterium]|nr:SDR family NAD(P)-dependent oxidoreductase [Caldilineaceae bacterium]
MTRDASIILITGATDGIGLALARQYAQSHARLILIGRRPLAELADPLFTNDTYCQVDLTERNCAEHASFWLHENHVGAIDLVIHNAGMGYIGPVADQGTEEIRRMIAVNLRAPIALTHALFPHVAAAQGKFVFISSVVSALPGPDFAVYTATKAALDGFVRNWQIELAASGQPVRAQLIRPGATRTGMHAKSGATFDTRRFASPEAVAEQIRRAIGNERRAVTLGRLNQLARFAGRHFGGFVEWGMARRARSATPATPAPAARPHCAITGAADGIGKALAFRFAADGYAIIGVDRDEEGADAVQRALADRGAQAAFLVGDLSRAAECDRLAAALTGGPPLDVLIHNAGISAVGPFVDSDLAAQQAVLSVNLEAPLVLTAAILQRAHLSAHGTIVFLSSLSHFVSYPGAAVYAASKDGLAAYARSVAVALSPAGIHVLSVFPGPTRTAHARRYSPDNRREARRMAPDLLASQIFNAIRLRRKRLIPGWGARLAAIGAQVAPRIFEALMRRAIFDKIRGAPQSKV